MVDLHRPDHTCYHCYNKHDKTVESSSGVNVYHRLGKVHSWNFSSEKYSCFIFLDEIFSYSSLLILFNGKNISCVKFSSKEAADEKFLTANLSQTTVHSYVCSYIL